MAQDREVQCAVVVTAPHVSVGQVVVLLAFPSGFGVGWVLDVGEVEEGGAGEKGVVEVYFGGCHCGGWD